MDIEQLVADLKAKFPKHHGMVDGWRESYRQIIGSGGPSFDEAYRRGINAWRRPTPPKPGDIQAMHALPARKGRTDFQIASQIVDRLLERLGPAVTDAWFQQVRIAPDASGWFVINCRSNFWADWLQNHYAEEITYALETSNWTVESRNENNRDRRAVFDQDFHWKHPETVRDNWRDIPAQLLTQAEFFMYLAGA